jgi:hypothetical protein
LEDQQLLSKATSQLYLFLRRSQTMNYDTVLPPQTRTELLRLTKSKRLKLWRKIAGGCLCVLQFDQNSVLYCLYHAPSACEFQSFALLN